MADYVSTSDPGDLEMIASMNTYPGAATQPSMFASPDTDENMVPAEEGAMGVVGPAGGPSGR